MITAPADNVRKGYFPLSGDEVDRIHRATMDVLENVGFKVHNRAVLDLFRRRGARVDSRDSIVTLTESAVSDILAPVPPQFTLCGRDERHDLRLGIGEVFFSTGGTALYVLDYHTGNRRHATMRDLVDIVRVVDEMKHVHCMLLPTYPNELPVELVDVNRFFAGFMYTKKHIMGGVYTGQGIRDVIAMAARIAGSPAALRERPFLSMIACGISPLLVDEKYSRFMMDIARAGIPVAVPAEPLCGATAPITLAGTLVVQNCDALINVMITQLANPGTPVMYGCVASSTDLRDLGYVGGSVESGLLNAAAAQMARHYRIPCYTTAGISDSKTLDAQAGYESGITNLLVALARADFVHDAAGLMEFAMTVSKEKLVIDNEILGMVLRAARGISLSDETLAVDEIAKAGPGGNFIRARHTRRHMHREHYALQLGDRDKREGWENKGGLDTPDRAREIVERILAAPPREYIDRAVTREIIEKFPVFHAGSPRTAVHA